MKLTIDNRDLNYTIDMYQLFSGESYIESEIEYYNEVNGANHDYDCFEWHCDMAGARKELALSSINLLHNEFVLHGGGIVKSIELAETNSPKYYNYTTDSYIAEWHIDIKKLKKYILDNFQEFREYTENNWSVLSINWSEKKVLKTIYSGKYMTAKEDIFKDDDCIVAMLDFYTQNNYSREDYFMAMFECEYESYCDNYFIESISSDCNCKKVTTIEA